MDDVLLGIDVGSTATKAAIYRRDGSELASAEAPTRWTETASGAEIDPESFVTAVFEAAGGALAQVPDVVVASLGITSMAETGVMVGDDGRSIGPAIAWYDNRTRQTATDLGAALGTDWFAETTGLILQPRVSATHVRWMMDNVSGCERATTRLNVAEWVAFRLGGRLSADLSLSARTGLLDITTRSWLPEVADWAGISTDLLPALTQPGDDLGTVDRTWSGLAGSTITTAGHDKPCAALGAGVTAEDEVYNSCGTAEALITSRRPSTDRASVKRAVEAGLAIGWHVHPNRQSVLGGLPTGRSLTRVLELLGIEDDHRSDLDRAALDRSSRGTLAIDGLMNDQMTLSVSGWGYRPEDLWWAAVSAAARQASALFTRLDELAGPLGRVVMSGGWTRSEAFMEARRREFDQIERSVVRRPGTRGAAMIAGVAARWWTFSDIPAPISEHEGNTR